MAVAAVFVLNLRHVYGSAARCQARAQKTKQFLKIAAHLTDKRLVVAA
ncbi:hypothetical protein SDC9_196593 [bioreactor metagenome]|uniref:Uncharacterized protein n=1 Tax=bioreactor metagenome TaxID=1076179 RepID=A0A645ICW9_9ZZZZ